MAQPIVGAPTLSGEIKVGPANCLTLILTIKPDWPTDLPLTGHGVGFETGEPASTTIKSTPLSLYGTTYEELRSRAMQFDIESHHTGLKKDDSFSIISFYNEGGFDMRVASAVITPSLDIRTIKKGHLDWLLLNR